MSQSIAKTSQWPHNCDVIVWIVISNSLDIDYIHGNIHVWLCKKKVYSLVMGQSRDCFSTSKGTLKTWVNTDCSWMKTSHNTAWIVYKILEMLCMHYIAFRADFRFVPSQWEMALLCNDTSHWLGASLDSALALIAELIYHCGQQFTDMTSWH